MGKIKWNTSGAEVDEVEVEEREVFEPYDGPIPGKTVLRVVLKWARVTEFQTGNGGLKLLFEVSEPRSTPKAKYNGCPIFENLVDTDTQAWKIRQFMDAIGGSGKDWDNVTATKDERDNQVVQKFGRIKADGLALRVLTKTGESNNGDPRAEVARYLPKVADEGDGADSDGGATNDDDEPPF